MMTKSKLKLAIYLTGITLGMAFILTGISWLCLLGCAITLSALKFFGHFSRVNAFTALLGHVGLFISLVGGIWQFLAALRHGLVWLRVPPPWWFVAFVLVAWFALLLREFWQGSSQNLSWQAALRRWTVRRLSNMPRDKRERFLAQFDQATQESYRKECETE
jgi:hypothetical protein